MTFVLGLLGLCLLCVGIYCLWLKRRCKELFSFKDLQLASLEDERIKREQILLSVNDAILIVNAQGYVESLNGAAQRLIGWTQEEAVGKPYQMIYRSDDPVIQGQAQDPIGEVFQKGEVARGVIPTSRDHVILTARAGQKFTVIDKVSPLLDQKGHVNGVLCVFRDVGRREMNRDRITQLTFRDSLTGLYNRVFFDQEFPRLDSPEHWPLSIMLGDLNGLKLTNDIFGHSVGDELLISVAQTFSEICRPEDRIFRWGGDEFVVLLPRTGAEKANEIRRQLSQKLSGRAVGPIKLHLPIGCATKESALDDLQTVWQTAEEEMYWQKTLGQATFQKEILDNLKHELFSRSSAEKDHAERVSELAERFGKFLGLSCNQQRKLRDVGLVHDIGKIVLDNEFLFKSYPLKPSEFHEVKRHPLVGFRILNFFEDTADLAGIVLAHHEQWDGSGYPKGLKGDEIPLLGRILAIIETYDRMLFDPLSKNPSSESSLKLIRDSAGSKFDPQLCLSFVEMMLNSKNE